MHKEIDVHKDFTMFQLVSNMRHAVSMATCYFQNTTPYGEAYQKAFKLKGKVNDLLDEFENALQECIEARESK